MNSLKTYLIQLSVVTLGVLIAFAIERANEAYKNNKQKKQYLNALHENLVDDKENLDSAMIYLENRHNNLVILDSIQGNAKEFKETEEVHKSFNEIIQLERFNLKSDIYESMLVGGKIELIDNFDLKNQIVTYYSLAPDAVDLLVNKEWKIFEEKIIPEIYYNQDFTYETIRPKLVELDQFNQSQISNYFEFSKKADSLIINIEQELNK